jgi:signal transduction histidine kinase
MHSSDTRPGDSTTAPDGTAGRAELLLAATNRFLRCDDLDKLAVAALDAVDELFDPTKSAIVLVQPDGSLALVTTRGHTAADREPRIAAIRGPTELVQRVADGGEVWSDRDHDAGLQDWLAAHGGRTSFHLPIVAGNGVLGNVSVLFAEERVFDEGLRAVARSLVAQVGRGVEVIQARDRLRDAASLADRERRHADVLLRVADDLATVTDPVAIPPILARAVRESSGASFAAVGRNLEDGGGFAFLAGDGLTPDQEAIFRSGPITPSDLSAAADLLIGKPVAGTTMGRPGRFAGLGADTFSIAPILVEGRVWGVLGLGANDELSLATGWWAELARGFASIAATAIARAEAVDALARQRDLLEADTEERTLHLTAALEELQRASDAKTAFLANVSHELRTPLTSILGFIEILATGMDGPLNPIQAGDVETIQASSRHLLELIDDLIDVASIESNRILLEIAAVPLAELLRECAEAMRPLAGQKGIGLELMPVDPELIVRADRGRLREIVLNLLSNAIKFTPPAGRVRLSAGAEPTPAPSGSASPGRPGRVRIDVRDSGIGVAEADQERIFETFVRTAGPSYSGTGLGLAIARELARLHHGDLTVESTVGLGSTFSVDLPLAGPGASR